MGARTGTVAAFATIVAAAVVGHSGTGRLISETFQVEPVSLLATNALGLGFEPGNLAAAMAAQDALTADLISQPGVVATAVGLDAQGRAVVKVYMEPSAVTALPMTFDGVPVLSVASEKIWALGHEPGYSDDANAVNPKARFERPVPIGVSTGQPDVTAGTIGARVTDGSEVFALSNNHVYANRNMANLGDDILQPGTADGGSTPDAIGTLHDYQKVAFCKGMICQNNTIDAAIALTTTDNLGNETPSNGYGSPRDNTMAAKLNLAVQKYGRTTGHTKGRITGINATVNVNFRTGTARFVDQIMIQGNSQTFSAGGDSGSLIVSNGLGWNDRRPVGLLFAGSATNTIANPIDLVLDRFDVRIDGN